MSRKITITMTEEVVTTIEVDEHWLSDNNLPGNLDTLRSGDYDDELFEAIDSIEPSDDTLSVAVTERDFQVEEQTSACEFSTGSHHSDDLVEVFVGRKRPVKLCGYHSTWDLTQILAAIPA